MNVPEACQFTLSKLYCIVPFVVVAVTLTDPLLILHPFGSVFDHVIIVITLALVASVSDTATALHPLIDHTTLYVPHVTAAILDVVAPLLHT